MDNIPEQFQNDPNAPFNQEFKERNLTTYLIKNGLSHADLMIDPSGQLCVQATDLEDDSIELIQLPPELQTDENRDYIVNGRWGKNGEEWDEDKDEILEDSTSMEEKLEEII